MACGQVGSLILIAVLLMAGIYYFGEKSKLKQLEDFEDALKQSQLKTIREIDEQKRRAAITEEHEKFLAAENERLWKATSTTTTLTETTTTTTTTTTPATTTKSTTTSMVLGLSKPAKKISSKLMVMVISARSAFDRRQAIRETWASGHDNVIYLVGGSYCPISPEIRATRWHCLQRNNTTPDEKKLKEYTDYEENINEKLKTEADTNGDTVALEMVDVYRHLPRKVKLGYKHILENYPNVEWLAKADDDAVVRVGSLEKWIEGSGYNSSDNVILGMIKSLHVGRKYGQKNAEFEYLENHYPPFPIGSYGHIISRPVAQWIVDRFDDLRTV